MKQSFYLKNLFCKGGKSLSLLLLLFLSVSFFAFGTAFASLDETVFVSNSISHYEKTSGRKKVYGELSSQQTDENGFYNYSECVMPFYKKALASAGNPKIKNKYFYVGSGEKQKPSAIIENDSGEKFNCRVLLPAIFDAKGESFGFSEFNDNKIIFPDDSQNHTTVYFSEKLASDFLGDALTKNNYERIYKKNFLHSIDFGSSFTSFSILGVIKQASLGDMEPILGDYFIFAPYCSAYQYYRFLHMGYFLSDSIVENESALASFVFSKAAKFYKLENKFFNFENGEYAIGTLNEQISTTIESFPSLSRSFLIASCSLVTAGFLTDLFFFVILISLCRSFLPIGKNQRDNLFAILFFLGLLALLFSVFLLFLFRYFYPPCSFVPFSSSSMLLFFLIFLLHNVVQFIICSRVSSVSNRHSHFSNVETPVNSMEIITKTISI